MATAATGKSGDPARDVAELEAEILQLKRDLQKLAKDMQAAGEHGVDTAKRAAAFGAEHLRAQGEAKLEELRAGARDVEAQIEAHVRAKPMTSLAIAAGVGFLFALIARR